MRNFLKTNSLRLISLLSILAFSTQSSAFEESESLEKMISLIEDGHKCENGSDFWKRKVVEVTKNIYSRPSLTRKFGKKLSNPNGTYRMRYSKYGCELGNKGAIVISPGRGESSVDYYETAIDFINRGYGPIYALDHRGQGLSPRLSDDLQKHHLVNYKHYLTDMNSAVQNILNDLKKMGRKDEPLFLTSNSMGGGIALLYSINKGPFDKENPFTSMALLAPTIKINYLSYVHKDPTWLNTNVIYTEKNLVRKAWYICGIPIDCTKYAADEFSDYKPTEHILKNDASDENFMTHSRERFNFHRYLYEEFPWEGIAADEYQNENWSSVLIGGATAGWVLSSTPFFTYLRSTKAIKKLPNKPIFIMTGEFDHRVYRPYFTGEVDENGDKVIEHDLSYHIDYCNDVNKHNVHNNNELCRFHEVKDAFHELYKETDNFRNDAINRVDEFFMSTVQKK